MTNTDQLLHTALHATADASDRIVAGSGRHYRAFARKGYGDLPIHTAEVAIKVADAIRALLNMKSGGDEVSHQLEHTLLTQDDHNHKWQNEYLHCPVCVGGLAICKVCGKAEGELNDYPCINPHGGTWQPVVESSYTVRDGQLRPDLTGIHDSHECRLSSDGGPCGQCVEANQWENSK